MSGHHDPFATPESGPERELLDEVIFGYRSRSAPLPRIEPRKPEKEKRRPAQVLVDATVPDDLASVTAVEPSWSFAELPPGPPEAGPESPWSELLETAGEAIQVRLPELRPEPAEKGSEEHAPEETNSYHCEEPDEPPPEPAPELVSTDAPEEVGEAPQEEPAEPSLGPALSGQHTECPPEAEEPALASRLSLDLCLLNNTGLCLKAGTTAVVTTEHLHISGAAAFLVDILLEREPRCGTLLRDGFALTVGDVFTQEDIDQGRISYRHDGSAGSEDDFLFTTPLQEIPPTPFAITLSPTHLAPRILRPGRLPSTLEGCRIRDILADSVQCHEDDVEAGLAIVALTGQGSWRHSLDGQSWQAIRKVSATGALLLGPQQWLRFVPRAGSAGEAQVSYRVWDGSSGQPGELVDLSGDDQVGGMTAFSQDVAAVATRYEAPVAPPSVSVPEPWLRPLTARELLGGGLAVVRLAGEGAWQYSLDGQNWSNFGEVYHGRARLLRADDLLRFVPRPGASGKVILSGRTWDEVDGVSGGAANLAGRQSTGDGTPYGAEVRTRTWHLNPA